MLDNFQSKGSTGDVDINEVLNHSNNLSPRTLSIVKIYY